MSIIDALGERMKSGKKISKFRESRRKKENICINIPNCHLRCECSKSMNHEAGFSESMEDKGKHKGLRIMQKYIDSIQRWIRGTSAVRRQHRNLLHATAQINKYYFKKYFFYF